MAHLAKLPTYFVKGEERRAAYYTIQARELIAEGFVEEGEKAEAAPVSKPVPEILVEAGVDAFDTDSIKAEEADDDLEFMTKAELLDFAMEHGVDLKNNLPKAEILEACRKLL